MANESYSLNIKVGTSDEWESYATYKAVVLEGTDRPQNFEPCNVTSQEWYGEGGEDVYIPSGGVKFKAFDWKVKMGIKDSSKANVKSKFDGFIGALKGGTFKVTDNYSGVTMSKCYLKGVSQEECELSESGSYMVFDLTIRVVEP